VKVFYRPAAADDVARQFRYYLVTLDVPEVAERFRDAVRISVQALRQHLFLGFRYRLRNPKLQNLRVWPVAGFETLRIYQTNPRTRKGLTAGLSQTFAATLFACKNSNR
jgi:plasmid stabilization system protein ParE